MSEKKKTRSGFVWVLLLIVLAWSGVVLAQTPPSFSLGTVFTNPDGSKGVVFYINPT